MKCCIILIFIICGQVFAVLPEVFSATEEMLGLYPDMGDDDEWEETHGGYLLVSRFDITGDGIPEVLIGFSGIDRNSEVYWHVFRGLGGERYEPYMIEKNGGMVPFGFTASGFVTLKRDNASVYIVDPLINTRGDHDGPYQLDIYRLFESRVYKTEIKGSELSNQRILENSGFKQLNYNVQGILLADFLRFPKKKWQKMDLTAGVPMKMGYFVLPKDKERIARLGGFTPELARKWLKTARLGREPEGDTSAYDSPPPVKTVEAEK